MAFNSGSAIREVNGVWVPREASMRHKLEGSYTDLRVVLLAPNPETPRSLFTQRQLETRKLRLPPPLVKGAVRF